MKCEACGIQSASTEYIKIRTTNGALTLCRLCLNDINRKNPDLIRLKSIMIHLKLDPEQYEHTEAKLTPEEALELEQLYNNSKRRLEEDGGVWPEYTGPGR